MFAAGSVVGPSGVTTNRRQHVVDKLGLPDAEGAEGMVQMCELCPVYSASFCVAPLMLGTEMVMVRWAMYSVPDVLTIIVGNSFPSDV